MKYLNTKLSSLALLSLILILSSCSQQRYASRSFSKVKPVASKEVKKAPETASAENTTAQIEEIQSPQAAAAEVTPVQAQAEPTASTPTQAIASTPANQAVKAKAKTTEAKPVFSLKNKIAKRAATKALKQFKKQSTLDKEDTNGDINISNKWVRLFIIGLILLLIGILLPGAIGYVFYLVGSIIMLIALIGFLIQLL